MISFPSFRQIENACRCSRPSCFRWSWLSLLWHNFSSFGPHTEAAGFGSASQCLLRFIYELAPSRLNRVWDTARPIGIVHEFRWPVFTNIILKQRHLLTISLNVNGIWRLSTNLIVNGVKWWDINQLQLYMYCYCYCTVMKDSTRTRFRGRGRFSAIPPIH